MFLLKALSIMIGDYKVKCEFIECLQRFRPSESLTEVLNRVTFTKRVFNKYRF